MDGGLDGRHAVVTGGGSGIGAAIAARLYADGANVTVIGRTRAKLDTTVQKLPHAHAAVADVTQPDQIAEALATAAARFGDVAILVNNAGYAPARPFLETDLATWEHTLQVNLTGAFLCAQAVLPLMRAAGWGRIVNIASTAGLVAYKGVAAYVAAKHGLVGLTRALALEYADVGITANAVCPGYTETEMAAEAIANIRAHKNISEADARAVLAAKNPQKRLIAPTEVADMVAWLCRPESSAVTGQCVAVAGGEVMT